MFGFFLVGGYVLKNGVPGHMVVFFLFVCLFVFFSVWPQNLEVPGLGIKQEPLQRPHAV